MLTVICSLDLRNQVSQEREAVRRITLQKDIELKEFQGKVEKAVSGNPYLGDLSYS